MRKEWLDVIQKIYEINMYDIMDAIQLEEENNVVIEIDIDEMVKVYDNIILRITCQDEILKELKLEELMSYEEDRW